MDKYVIKESSRARRMSIRVTAEKKVVVTVPRGIPKILGQRFAAKHEQWIKKQLDKNREHSPLELKDGMKLPLFGKPTYTLKIIEGTDEKPQISQEDKTIIVETANPEDVKQSILSLYKAIAKEYIPNRTAHFAAQLGVTYNNIFIKNQKSRWGSCSTNKNINFNYRLIMAPLDVIDYVIVHELCHLIEMNHSKQFWNLVKSILPNYKKPYRWLRTKGSSLTVV